MPSLRAEALRRLGDLNLESSESERIERELVTNEGLRATEAIHLYSALLKTYPKYERNDSVLYQLARAYELNAQPDKALASLDQLVASYPASHYLDEAQFRRGELLFSAKAYPKAQLAYEAVIKIGPSSAFYNQSLYKHGWSLFKQGENERSLDSFAGVLDPCWCRSSAAAADGRARDLEPPEPRIGGGYLSRHEHHVLLPGRPEIHRRIRQAPHAARPAPRPYSYLLYARLGDLYIEKERYTDAADSYRAFVSQDRNNEKAPLLEMQAIEAYAKGRFSAARAARQEGIRRELQLRHGVLAGPRSQERAEGRGGAQDQSQGRGAVLPCPGATHQERRRLSGSGEVVSRLSDAPFPTTRIRRSRIFCSPTRCSRASNIWMRRRNTKAPPITTAIMRKRRRRVMPPSSPTASRKRP